jgi:hypothetical protein
MWTTNKERFCVWNRLYIPHRKLAYQTLPSPADLIFKGPGNSKLPAAQTSWCEVFVPTGYTFWCTNYNSFLFPVMNVLTNLCSTQFLVQEREPSHNATHDSVAEQEDCSWLSPPTLNSVRVVHNGRQAVSNKVSVAEFIHRFSLVLRPLNTSVEWSKEARIWMEVAVIYLKHQPSLRSNRTTDRHAQISTEYKSETQKNLIPYHYRTMTPNLSLKVIPIYINEASTTVSW